jgi:hypothetical protein
MLDYNYFINTEELDTFDLERLEELQKAINHYIITLSADKIFNELFLMSIPVNEFDSDESFVFEDPNFDEFRQNFLRILKGNDIGKTLETIKLIKTLSKSKNNTYIEPISHNQAIEIMTDLLCKNNAELNVTNSHTFQNEVLTIMINLLLKDVTDTRNFITVKVLTNFNTILNRKIDELTFGILLCIGLIVYRITYLDKSNNETCGQLKELCKRLKDIFMAEYHTLSFFLSYFALTKVIGEFDNFFIVTIFIRMFKGNTVILQCLDYFEILLKYTVYQNNQQKLVNVLDILLSSNNPLIMTRSSMIIINSMKTNNEIRKLFLESIYKKLLGLLKNLQDNNLMLNFMSVFRDSFEEDENFLAVYEKIFDCDFLYYALRTQDPNIFLSCIKILKMYLMTVSINILKEFSSFLKEEGLLRRFEDFSYTYTEDQRNEIEIVLNLIQMNT